MNKYLKTFLILFIAQCPTVGIAVELKGYTEVTNAIIKEPDGCWPIKSGYHDMADLDGSTRSKKHLGIDIVAPKGTPVIAAADGKVIYTGRQIVGGKTIHILHGKDIHENIIDGYYIHLDEIKVEEGQLVKRGEIIGTVGNTGTGMPLSKTAHLHFEVKLLENENATFVLGWLLGSKPISPTHYLKQNIADYKFNKSTTDNKNYFSKFTYPVICSQ
jgi:murein DD-endopeptidase MepM/ murein hydrolase activator NlpD